MNKILTIAIPTFNRALLLDRQLAWLAKIIKGFESECEIFISDNCSTDNTQFVIDKWQLELGSTVLRAHRNNKNVGLVGNIACCLKATKTAYVWTVGDDDPIQNRVLPYILETLKKYPDLALLLLNFSGRDQKTGLPVNPPEVVGDRWFDVDSEDGVPDGKPVFEHCLEKSIGSVMFITAAVYRTELVQRALRRWPACVNNWIAQVYWTGFCAANGSLVVSQDIYIECVIGVSYWQREKKSALMMQFKHTPEVCLQLQQVGFSKRFCQRMIVKNFKEARIKVFVGALRRWPFLTIKTVIPFIALTLVSALQLGISKKLELLEARILERREPKEIGC